MPYSNDFAGYVPIGGSSTLGHLSINAEQVPGGVTVLDLHYDTHAERWEVTASESVDFSHFADSALAPTARNCSGGITPWGTVITCEEFETTTDLNGDGYFDLGWSVEIDPVTRQVMDQDGDSLPDKLWALGHFKHENAAIAQDSITVYQGEDNSVNGFLFKFVADEKMKLGSGNLYVLQRVGNGGQWLQVPNASQRDRNRTVFLADSLGGTRFFRIEDVEIGPEGKVYFASTAAGRVYRFRDHGSQISHFETFIENQVFPIQHRNGVTNTWFSSPDNLAFDGDGNLWVLQDGGPNHIWVFGPQHSSLQPQVRLFANTVLGSEPTGITFTPDFRFLFMSVQHPSGSNTQVSTDAAGNTIVFNRDATVVIARKEHLGTPLILCADASEPCPMQVFPNPAQDQVQVSLEADFEEVGTATVTVIEMLGRVTLSTTRELVAGHNTLQLDLTVLPPGNYVLLVKSKTRQRTITLSKN